MPARLPRILLINASLAGESGNTSVLLARARRRLARRASLTVITLAGNEAPDFAALRPQIAEADGLLIGTGTHWDSWSSVLQKFLEDATPAEGTALWLGKPVAVIVSEHSTGGKGVLSRLQGVLVTLGCTLPPMSGLVLSRAALIATRHDAEAGRDFWCIEDLRIVCHNLIEAASGTCHWKTWPVDRETFSDRWVR